MRGGGAGAGRGAGADISDFGAAHATVSNIPIINIIEIEMAIIRFIY